MNYNDIREAEAFKEEIKEELKPLYNFVELRFNNGKLYNIALRRDISIKDLKILGVIPEDTKKKDLIRLFDLFADNIDIVEIALQEIGE